MSNSGRKRNSRWDFKEDSQHISGNTRGDDYSGKSGSYFHDKESDPGWSYADGNDRNCSRRSIMDDDDDDNDEHLKVKYENRQHYGEAWPRNRIPHNGDSRSNSRSHSRSHSRSPSHREKRNVGFHDREKNRSRISPESGRDFDGRYRRGSDHQFHERSESGWESRNRQTRDPKYYSADFPEDTPRRKARTLHEPSSDAVLRRQREREIPRRESDAVPCRFYAAGNCRNGKNCRFAHHGPDRKPQDDRFRQDDDRRWNDFGARKSDETETKARVDASWIDDMEMSPDWNYGVHGSRISLGSRSSGLKETPVPGFNHHNPPSKAAVEKDVMLHQNYDSALNAAAAAAAAPMGHPVVAASVLPALLDSSKANSVTAEQLNHISSISGSLAQLFGTGLKPRETESEKQEPNQSDVGVNEMNAGVGEEKRRQGGEESEEEEGEEGEEEEEEKKGGKRAFKFALVEMVKEIMKPSWREGKMKKEGYKKIVKKVVDKVTASFQQNGGNFPPTPHKIHLYLSASKPKLTKLVQAYISKSKKS